MNRAFEDLFGISGAFASTQMAGRTDRWILDDAASRAGVGLTESNRRRFRDRYTEHLLEELPSTSLRTGPSTDTPDAMSSAKRVLPGVQPLLEVLASPPFSDQVFLALLTGNCEEGARIKLEHFDLWKFFRCGAFGDDVHDRAELFQQAIIRAEACGASSVHPRDVLVVGDTVLDVACAVAAGARSVAVATGPSGVDVLRASGADEVVEDLSDTERFLRLLSVTYRR